ncbi:DUF4142 domain-containing protein [Glaciimonas sp. GG7]
MDSSPARVKQRFFFLIYGCVCAVALLCAGSVSAADLSRHEKLFLMHVAEGGYAELEASSLVISRAANPEIQTFAKAMTSDQQIIAVELARLASAKGVILPETTGKIQQVSIVRLSKLTGVRFDKEYSREIGVLANMDQIALFQQAQKRAKDPDVKAFASKFLPMLRQHLEMGQQLKLVVDKRKMQ